MFFEIIEVKLKPESQGTELGEFFKRALNFRKTYGGKFTSCRLFAPVVGDPFRFEVWFEYPNLAAFEEERSLLRQSRKDPAFKEAVAEQFSLFDVHQTRIVEEVEL